MVIKRGSVLGRLPEKRYFKIGEVSRLTGLEPHTIRYWESEFPQLDPLRVGSKQRLYRPEDLSLLKTIARLLHQERYTIAGARRKLAERPSGPEPEPQEPALLTEPERPETGPGQLLAEISRELKDILRVLS